MDREPGHEEGPAAQPGRCVLVLTTVHQAEDPRIRWRTVAALSEFTRIRYAATPPSPVDTSDHEWVPLAGGRIRRALAGARESWRRDVAVVSLHDPELLPLGLVLRLVRRVPVVFDVHEDVPGQIMTKTNVPHLLRPVLARGAAALLRVAERVLEITLAEPNYQSLFRAAHPVLPNHPDLRALPEPQPTDGSVVYVGDVTKLRGALLAVEAMGRLPQPPTLRLIGRCAPELARRLTALAADRGVELDLPGFLPHPEAMAIVARAAVGLAPLADVPNYRDSLPTKTLEYLAMGVPVVASDLQGTASALRGLQGVALVPSGHVDAWSAGIAQLLNDPPTRESVARQAPWVRERYRFRSQDVWAVYEPLLSVRSGGA